MKTAIVHIGSPKTGSTSIQSALKLSSKQMQERGVFYFGDYPYAVQLLSMAFRSRKKPLLRIGGVTASEVQSASYKYWISLSRTVREKNIKFTILSEEAFFFMVRTRRFSQLLRTIFDRIFIITYVRNPIAKFSSWLDQRIRDWETIDLLSNSSKRIDGDLSILDEYCRYFGKDNLFVRNFDNENLYGESVISDFQNIICSIVNADVRLTATLRENVGLPAASCAFFLSENERLVETQMPVNLEKYKHREKQINFIRGSEKLMQFPKLALTDPNIVNHLNAISHTNSTLINERYLKGQIKFEVIPSSQRMSTNDFKKSVNLWISSQRDARFEATLKRSYIEFR